MKNGKKDSVENGEKTDDKEEDGKLKKEKPKRAPSGAMIFTVFGFQGILPQMCVPPSIWLEIQLLSHEAVEEVPEYVVPWEAFRALQKTITLKCNITKHLTRSGSLKRMMRFWGL